MKNVLFTVKKLYYFVAVLSLTYTPILPTFFNKKVDKIKKNVKKRKNVTEIKKRKGRFLHLWAEPRHLSHKPRIFFIDF